MSLYQGRALRADLPRRRGGRLRRILVLLAALTVLPVVAQAPWAAWRHRLFAIREIRVEGVRYLDAPAVIAASGVKTGADLFALDLDRVRQALLLHPRVARARVERILPAGIRLHIDERSPVLLVEHGAPWELDSTGVLLPPLAEGVVADVPMLAGVELSSVAGGTLVDSPQVQRGLAWARSLGIRELQLAGSISEIDVSDERMTALTLLNGTRVLSPAWPPGTRALSALRVVLADLQQRGTVAE
ncbi:MAG TPA: FtsQ-type POTRA domain-containing protein, partial [Planctomycetota bacterium]|nr:FtsQ-type POTRA domain-containing protein [Planctomycetota bacterium]